MHRGTPSCPSLSLLLLCLFLLASPLPAQNFPGDAPQALASARRTVEAAADELLANPSSPGRHLAMARAYFERGAVEDARRVRSHLARAVELDPDFESKVESMLRTARAGARGTDRSAEELALDRRVATTLPSASTLGGGGDVDEQITSGLADRVLRRDFRIDPTSYSEVRKDLCRIFGWKSGEQEDQQVWPERLDAARQRKLSRGWQGSFERALVASINEFNSPQAMRAGWNRPGGSSASPSSSDDEEEMPNPLESRSKAIQAWAEKEPEKAVDHFLDAIAATEVERAKRNEEAPVLAQARTAPAAPAAPPESGTASGPPPAQPPSPGPENEAGRENPEESLPPEVNRELGQRGMETVEALSNPEVPMEDVNRKVTETASVGIVGEPLILDLNGDGRPNVSGLLPDGRMTGRSVAFDLDGDGHAERCEWLVPGGDGLLAVDLDEDGVIRTGRELFGTATGDRDGFCRLARFDLDGDGWIRSIETRSLKVWQDDGDGICQPEELRSLAAWGITAISCRNDGPVAAVTGPGPARHVWEWYPDTSIR